MTRYAYHHGYFDGEEREFRGFAMVEQFDAEEFAPSDDPWHVPPVLTRTWFHTGMYLGPRPRLRRSRRRVLQPAWAAEPSLLLPDTMLPSGLTPDEEREACRALKGSMLRQEVYALDGSDREAHPYTVTEQNFTIAPLQLQATNRHAVFFTHPREALMLPLRARPRRSPDRARADARGRCVRQRAQVARDRLWPRELAAPHTVGPRPADDDADHVHRERVHERGRRPRRAPHAASVRDPDVRADRLQPGAERRAVQLRGVGCRRLCVLGRCAGARKRLLSHTRVRYRRNDLTGLLPLHDLEALALPGETYRLALTTALLADVFKRKRPGQAAEDLLPDPAAILEGAAADVGGYVELDGAWWVPSGTVFYAESPTTAALELTEARSHFFVPRLFRDPFGNETTVRYGTGDLLVEADERCSGQRRLGGERLPRPASRGWSPTRTATGSLPSSMRSDCSWPQR